MDSNSSSRPTGGRHPRCKRLASGDYVRMRAVPHRPAISRMNINKTATMVRELES